MVNITIQAQTTSNTASLLDDLFSSPRESSGSGGFSLLDSGGADSLGALLEPMAVFQPTVTPAQVNRLDSVILCSHV